MMGDFFYENNFAFMMPYTETVMLGNKNIANWSVKEQYYMTLHLCILSFDISQRDGSKMN